VSDVAAIKPEITALQAGTTIGDRAIFAIAIAFSTFQIYTSAFSPLQTLVLRSVHAGFLLLLTFATYRRVASRVPRLVALDWLLGIAGFVLGLYHWVFEDAIIQRSGDPSTLDIAVGVAMIVLVFEAARRIMGPSLPLIAGAFLAYAMFGEYLPEPLAHRGYGFDQIINQLYLGTEGIFGIPAYVSATYIFLFILFGSFLEHAGMIRMFTDVAMGTVGHARGGPAKVAVISSAMMGTINGSGVANVMTIGQFTIPLMKRFGYRSEFAGAVEATASMGGQIMPPVMGAVAFIMAETIDVPYATIVKTATIPAILYFATVFWMVHLEAGRTKLLGLPRDQMPSPLGALRRDWHLLLPLAVLVYLLFAGYTPLFSGTMGLALTAILILGISGSRGLGTLGWRIVFWVILGLLASTFFEYGIAAIFGVIAVLVGLNFFVRGGRATLQLSLRSLADGATAALPVGIACVLVGVIIGVLTLTGAATNFGSYIIESGSHSLFLSLVLTMITSLVLGMGIPTIPNYIITSSLAAPALLHLGVPLIVSHMFVFYFGIMADLTPPVALAAFAASSIAKAPAMRIGLNCMRIAIAGFVIPFMAVYAPALMLQEGNALDVAYVVIKALLAIGLWGAAAIGYLWQPLTWGERVLATSAAFLVVVAIPLTDQAGFTLAAVFLMWHWRRRRSHAA
jgi:TRAP transporter 4TM/12TM fusion protein